MVRTVIRFLPLFLCLLALACARIGAPTGGEKDSTPPRVDTAASTPNFQTQFSARPIELTFDEYVTLQDVTTQIIVSPPLAQRPDVTLRGKTLRFQFDEAEILRPNTTYTISFGTAVKDFHEGNVAEDLRFVFSTGDQIDSLEIAGSVLDALTSEPLPDIAVLVYENLADSAALRERPFYYTRTDATGNFTVRNVRPDTFRLIAVDDADRNVRWNPASERIAFADSLIVTRPGEELGFRLRLYNEIGAARLIERQTNRYGIVRLTYSGQPDTGAVRALAPDVRLLTEPSRDTLTVYYDREAAGTWSLLVGPDTVAVRGAPTRAEFLQAHRVVLADDLGSAAPPSSGFRAARGADRLTPIKPGAPRSVSQNPERNALLPFLAPVQAVDTSRWLLTVDSQRVYTFTAQRDSARLRSVRLAVSWRPGKLYRLLLLPGAVTDMYGVSNVDTLQRTFSVVPEKQLGGLNLVLTNLTANRQYVLQLYNGTALEAERRFRATGTENRLEFRRLTTATYTARLIEDINANGQWDEGSFFSRLQPERVFNKKLEALRPNWEIEATLAVPATLSGPDRNFGKH